MAKKNKRLRIKRRVSTSWLVALVVVFLILLTALSAIAMLDILGEDIEEIDGLIGMDDDIKLLLLPIMLLIYACIGLFLMLKHILIFAPSILLTGFLIATAVLLSANAKSGKYCYKYSFCRNRAKVASIINIVLSGISAVYFLFVFDLLGTTNAVTTPLYRYAVLASAVMCAVVALLTYLDKQSGIRNAADDNVISEEEENRIKQEEFERKRAEMSASNVNAEGVAPHLTAQTLSANRDDK